MENGLGCAVLLPLAIFLECIDGQTSAGYFLVDGRFYLALGVLIASAEDVVHARHKALRVVSGHDTQGIGHVEPQRCRRLVLVVGLAERIDPCYSCQTLSAATIVERLHSSQFHGLCLGYLLTADMAREGSEQRGCQTYHGGYLEALLGKLELAFLPQVP